jgi:predicted PurR-regulated permease PerM
MAVARRDTQRKIGAMTGQGSAPELQSDSFARRVFIALLMAALAYACWRLSDLSALIFGSILFAVGLRAAAKAVSRRTGASNTLALVIVALVGLAGFGLAIAFFGAVIAGQINDLVKEVPKGFQIVMERVQANAFGRYALEQAKSFDVAGQTGWIARTFALIARSTVEGVAYAALIIFVSIYLAAEPERYRRLCLRLLPPERQPAVSRVFDATGKVLQRWLLGQLVVMIIIGVLSGIGLWLLGIESAIALGLVGGLLCFIPYVGAVLAAVPATLVALTQGPTYALSVLAMYAAVHFVEGNFITPFVQAETTSLPPVLSLLSVAVFGVLLGPSSVLIAAPLTLFLIVAVEVLYVEDALGQEPEVAKKDPE